MLIKQASEKKKELTKKIILSVGGLTMLIGAPLALVIACSDTSITTLEGETINDASTFIPNENGEITESLIGWNTDIVSPDELSTPLTNLNFNATTLYRIRFTLDTDYIVPESLDSELTLIDGSYYSDVRTYTNYADDVADLSMINANSVGEIDITYTGWDIDLVGINNGQTFVKTSLSIDEDYFIRFTLQSNYAEPINFDAIAMRSDFPDDKAYYSERKIHHGFAANVSNIYNIHSNEYGDLDLTLTGWDIDVVSPSDLNTQLTILNYDDTYKIRFTLKTGYSVNKILDEELTLDSNGSYYSSTRSFFNINLADEILNVDNIVSDQNGISTISVNGWRIDIVDSDNNILENLVSETEYYLKFTLLENYLRPTVITDDLTRNDDGSYYSEVKIFELIADEVNDLTSVFANSDALVVKTFVGWDVDVIGISNRVITEYNSLNIGESYHIRFTLIAGYKVPSTLDAITNRDWNSDDEYFSLSKIYKINASHPPNSGSFLKPDEAGIVGNMLTGWNIDVVDPNSLSTALNELNFGSEYKVRLTLQANYLAPINLDSEFILDSNGSYYTITKVFALAKKVTNVINIVSNSTGDSNVEIDGWIIEAVAELGGTKLINLNIDDNYLLKFTLASDYELPSMTESGLTINEDGSYYSDFKTFKYIAQEINDLSNVFANDNATIDTTFTGWIVDVVGISGGVPFLLDNLSNSERYFIRFTLDADYIIISDSDGISKRSDFPNDQSYYSDRKTHQSKADDIVNFDTIFPNENGIINSTLVGWDVDVVSPHELETPLSTLNFGVNYHLRFTLQANYLAANNIHSDLISNPNGSFYSPIRTFSFANELNNLSNVFSDQNGNANTEINGWDIDVVNNNHDVLTSLSLDDSYWFKFTLLEDYLLPNNISDDLTRDEDGSYYSNSSKSFKFFAAEVNNVNVIVPNNNGVISEIYEGWSVDTVKINNGVVTVFDALDIGERYFIRFTLNENYIIANGIDGVATKSSQAANEYYSIVKTHLGEVASAIPSIADIVPLPNGDVITLLMGWDIVAVSIIDSETILKNINSNVLYKLRFTLQANYLTPSIIDSKLTLDSNGSYYSGNRTFG